MYKALSTGFWAREPKKVKRASFLASMKEIVKMYNQAPNADIFYFVNTKGRIFYFFQVGVPKMTSSHDFS